VVGAAQTPSVVAAGLSRAGSVNTAEMQQLSSRCVSAKICMHVAISWFDLSLMHGMRLRHVTTADSGITWGRTAPASSRRGQSCNTSRTVFGWRIYASSCGVFSWRRRNGRKPPALRSPCPWSHTQLAHRRIRALEAAVRKLEVAQREQLPVPRFWAVSAASFAVAAAVLGSVALVALEYGRRSRPPSVATSSAPAVRPL
jgi:hypothetical protein